jgi:hypothetical protein
MPYKKVIFAIDSYYTNLSAFLFYHMQQAGDGAQKNQGNAPFVIERVFYS